MSPDDLERLAVRCLQALNDVDRHEPGPCLRRFVQCDADEGGPETWCESCRWHHSTRETARLAALREVLREALERHDLGLLGSSATGDAKAEGHAG